MEWFLLTHEFRSPFFFITFFSSFFLGSIFLSLSSSHPYSFPWNWGTEKVRKFSFGSKFREKFSGERKSCHIVHLIYKWSFHVFLSLFLSHSFFLFVSPFLMKERNEFSRWKKNEESEWNLHFNPMSLNGETFFLLDFLLFFSLSLMIVGWEKRGEKRRRG